MGTPHPTPQHPISHALGGRIFGARTIGPFEGESEVFAFFAGVLHLYSGRKKKYTTRHKGRRGGERKVEGREGREIPVFVWWWVSWSETRPCRVRMCAWRVLWSGSRACVQPPPLASSGISRSPSGHRGFPGSRRDFSTKNVLSFYYPERKELSDGQLGGL